MPDELHLLVEHGGQLTCTPATDARQRARQCTVAWGISVVLDGEAVRVRDLLPGLHLDLRAKRIAEHLPPDPGNIWPSLGEDDEVWERIEQFVDSMLNYGSGLGRFQYESTMVGCALHHHATLRDGTAPIAFTLQCQWPGVLGVCQR